MTIFLGEKLRKAVAGTPAQVERGVIVGAEGRNVVIVRTPNGVVRAINTVVASRIGLPVIIERRGVEWVVTGLDYFAFLTPPSYHTVPYHGEAHIMGHPDGGDDLIFLPKLQYLPLAAVPTTPPSLRVRICAGTIIGSDGRVVELADTYYDFGPIVEQIVTPTRVLLVINRENAFPEVILPDPVGTLEVPPGAVPLAIIKLAPGKQEIKWGDIVDARELPASRAGTGTNDLADLADVCISNIQDGDILEWDANDECWKNVQPPGAGSIPSTPFIIRGASVVQYSTIQEAIDDSADGENVFVPPGTYNESLVIGQNKRLGIYGWGTTGNIIVSGSSTLVQVDGQVRFHNIRFDWRPTVLTTTPMIVINAFAPIFTRCEFSVYSTDALPVTLFSIAVNNGIMMEWCLVGATVPNGGVLFSSPDTNWTEYGAFVLWSTIRLSGTWTIRTTNLPVSFYASFVYASDATYNESPSLGINNSILSPLPQPDVSWSIVPVRGRNDGDIVLWDGNNWIVGNVPSIGMPLKPFIIRDGIIVQYPTFDDALSDVRPGEAIYIPPGVHYVNSTPVVPIPISIRGMGGTLLFDSGTGMHFYDNCEIHNLDIRCLGYYSSSEIFRVYGFAERLDIIDSTIITNLPSGNEPALFRCESDNPLTIHLSGVNVIGTSGNPSAVISSACQLSVVARNCHFDLCRKFLSASTGYQVSVDMAGCTVRTIQGAWSPNEVTSAILTSCDFTVNNAGDYVQWTMPVPVSASSGGTLVYSDRWEVKPDVRQFVFCFAGLVEIGAAPSLTNHIREMTVYLVTARIIEPATADTTISVTISGIPVGLTLPAGQNYVEQSVNISILPGDIMTCDVASNGTGSNLTVTVIAY